jgi:hypothetical protein
MRVFQQGKTLLEHLDPLLESDVISAEALHSPPHPELLER